MNIDEWAAEQCGVDIKKYGNHFFYIPEGKIHQQREWWTIKDPRCREIVREHFKLVTEYYDQINAYWECWPTDKNLALSGIGKTIAEAEIACITAIYEAQKDE